MKKRYIVIVPHRGVVEFSSRFECVAEAVALAMRRVQGVNAIAYHVDCSPQAVADLVNHASALEDEKRQIAQRLHDAVHILANLVSRDEEGAWTTVHDADVTVAYQAEIEALLA